ncbi:MAG: hypothetical protein Fur0021_20990 [Candidatus Promineifilaceae bacterium]
MASEWRETTVGDFAPFAYGKGLPEGQRNANGNVPVYGSNGVVGYHDLPLTDGPTVVIGRKGTVGAVHYSPVACWPIDTTFFITGSDPLLVRYRYFVLKSLGLEHMNADSAVPGLNRDAAHARRVLIPQNKTEQRAIAHILGTLDDKIELNRRMSATLEQMARALFKAWFVDFEPVRVKMKRQGADTQRQDAKTPGRQENTSTFASLRPGVFAFPPHILDLFPARLVDSELGEIPEGWEVGTIKDCCIQIRNGGTPSRKEPRFWEGGMIPWLTSAEVRQPIITTTENFITEVGLEASSAKWVPPLSTAVALYGATAGQVSLVSLRLTTSQAVCALLPKQYFEFFNYLWMRSATMDLQNKAVGSAQQNISQEVVASTHTLIPPKALLENFDEMVKPLFGKWIYNLHESRTLAALRDTLLPKLISGALRVKDAEKFIGRVV